MKFRGVRNMYTCDWQQSVFMPDLEENQISAVLCISKNKKPPITISTYTTIGVQHYSANIENLEDEKLETELLRIARIIHHFVSNNQRILIHSGTDEDCVVAFAMIFYSVWIYYHNPFGTKKSGLKKPEYTITSQVIKELKEHQVETDLLHSMTQKLYKLESKYADSA